MFRREKKLPCVPETVWRELLKEVYSEVLDDMGYDWDTFENSRTVRLEVGTRVNASLIRGVLDQKVRDKGYRICEEQR